MPRSMRFRRPENSVRRTGLRVRARGALLALIASICPLCAQALAAPPPVRTATLDRQFTPKTVSLPGFLQGVDTAEPRPSLLERREAAFRERGASIEDFARRVSYAGFVLLTADRLIRSMDSVMENMELRCDDGTRLRLDVGPGDEGMGMMVRMSRPFDF